MEVLVLVDFEGQLSDELKIEAGDVVCKVHPGPEEGWFQGELEGRTGLFPQQFVQEIPASLRADGSQRCPRSVRSVHAVKKQPLPKQRWCQVTFPYTPVKEDELALCPGELVQILEEIEDGWWLGKKSGQLGAFPSNFVQELGSQPPAEPIFPEPKLGAAKQRPKVTDETFMLNESEAGKPEMVLEKPVPVIPKAQTPPTSAGGSPQYCRVMFDYEPAHEDELPLRKGDLVLLLNKDTMDVGWWEGQVHGKRGLFPDNFVMPLTHMPPGIKSQVPARSKDSATKSAKKFFQGNKVDLGHRGDHKDAKEQKKTDAPKSNPPMKKVPPPPLPVPARARPVPPVPHKSSNVPISCTPTPEGKGKPNGAETPPFDALLVPSVKLSHPTADRPKMPGKRPPSQPTAGSGVKESSSPVREEAAASEMPQMEEHPASLEDLKVELSSLKTHMELLRAQHRRDMEELKEQLCQEQSKRAALEAEIVQLKHTLAHGCRTVISGDRAPSLGAASPAQNSWLPVISTKDC